MYVRSLGLRNFRCFTEAGIAFKHPGHGSRTTGYDNVTLILGDNGQGKSSILKAIAIGLFGWRLQASGYVPYRLVKRWSEDATMAGMGSAGASIDLVAVLGAEERKSMPGAETTADLRVAISRQGSGNQDLIEPSETHRLKELMHAAQDEASSAFFVVGYGATRRVDQTFATESAHKRRGRRYQRVASLFEDDYGLRPLSSWLPSKWAARRLPEVIAVLDVALPPNLRFTGEFDEREHQYIYSFDGASMPFPSLSDGYRQYIAWVGDLLGHLADVTPPFDRLVDTEGVVLIDEIDLHLHPAWQRTVVDLLRNAFPRLQFVVTSHSPLVAGSLPSDCVFTSENDLERGARVTNPEGPTLGLSAEQLLLSPYFGLKTTRSGAVDERVADIERMRAAAAPGLREDADIDAGLAFLDSLTTGVEKPLAIATRKAAAKPRTRLVVATKTAKKVGPVAKQGVGGKGRKATARRK